MKCFVSKLYGDGVKSRLGILASVVAVSSWGFGNVLVKVIPLSGPAISIERLLLGSALAFFLMIATGRRIGWREILISIPGGIAFGLNIILFFSAVKYTSPTTATVIETLQPALLMLVVGKLFGEKVRLSSIIGGFIAFVGAVGIVLGAPSSAHDSLFGDFLAVLALLSYSAYFVVSKKTRQKLGTLEYQVSIQLVAAALVGLIVVISGSSVKGTPHDWFLLGILTIIPGGGHYLVNWSHSHTSLSSVSLLTLLTPVVTILFAYPMLGEKVTVAQALGLALVIGGLTVVVQRGLLTGSQKIDPQLM